MHGALRWHIHKRANMHQCLSDGLVGLAGAVGPVPPAGGRRA